MSAGHFLHLENPGQVNDHILGWVDFTAFPRKRIASHGTSAATSW